MSWEQRKEEAKQLGEQYSDWSQIQLTQSAEMANDLAPEIRRLAGYDDIGTGTYTSIPLHKDMEEIQENETELWDIFWDSFYDNQKPTPNCPSCKDGIDH